MAAIRPVSRLGIKEGIIMKKAKDNSKQLEDIVDIEDHAFSIAVIELIATNEEARRYYENKFIGCLYSSILISLTHESFSEAVAKSLWDEMVAHMGQLNSILGRDVGISVASLDYLSNIKSKLSAPKIMEEDKSEFIAEATTKDELTGLYLREVFDAVLKKEIAEADRKNSPLSLLMIDIDNFKRVNDKYGHLEGDRVLYKIGTAINESVREMDLAARYGGEELAVIIPDTETNEAFKAAERIREKISQLKFDGFSVTVSIGTCQSNPSINTAEKLINAADTALYRAKNTGKNRVVTHNEAN
jgi:diguanylate cyclase (GGDEF)-like protein